MLRDDAQVITSESRDLLREAVASFPLDTKGFSFYFLNGRFAFDLRISEMEAYEKECVVIGTMPYEHLNWRYDKEAERFVPDKTEGEYGSLSLPKQLESNPNPQNKKKSLDRIFKILTTTRGRPASHYFGLFPNLSQEEIDYETLDKAYVEFRRRHLENLFGVNYRIYEGQVFAHMLPPRENTLIERGGVIFRDEEGFNVVRTFGEIPDDRYDRLVKWFEGLREKYS